MAIMTRCCCFNTRSGTLASAIFSLIHAGIYIGFSGWILGRVLWIDHYADKYGRYIDYTVDNSVLAMCYLKFVAYALTLVSCILAMVGYAKDMAALLLPYIICVLFMVTVEICSYVLWFKKMGFYAVFLLVPFIFFLIFLAINILCVLCVISQFQELKAGRGRSEDMIQARPPATTTVVMTAQQHPTATVVVTQQAIPVAVPAYTQPSYAPPGYGLSVVQPPPPPPNDFVIS